MADPATVYGEIVERWSKDSLERSRAFYLAVLSGANVGEKFRINGGEAVIGRGEGVAVRLRDDGISRNHARVVTVGSKVTIEDLGSSNGTYVNSQRVSVTELHDGDKIRLGSATLLKFSYHDHLDASFQQRIYDAALRDDVTGAFRREYFLQRMAAEMAEARRSLAHLSLLMFHIDDFKRVNDDYGHVAGDYVLQRLARLASSTVRPHDVLGRYGSSKFGVVCRGVGSTAAGILAERLRSTVKTSTFEHESNPLPITISVGVAAYPDLLVETDSQLIEAALEALDEATLCGRNRVVIKVG